MGDFNERVNVTAEIMLRYDLRGVVPPNTATHNKGGHLDLVFSNLDVLDWSLQAVDFTDHSVIAVKLALNKTHLDVDISCMPTRITQAEMRKQSVTEETA